MKRERIDAADIPSFIGENFDNLDFSTSELKKYDMNDAVFHSCNFYNAETRSGCSFRGCKLRNATFINCDLSMCRFEFADLFGTEFSGCRMIGTNLEGGSFAEQLNGKKYICSGKIENSNLSNACLAGLQLQGCFLKGNRWYETDIEKTDFSGADLSDGEFSGIQWATANFKGCDLRGASLQGLDIRTTDLSGAILDTWQACLLVSALGVTVI